MNWKILIITALTIPLSVPIAAPKEVMESAIDDGVYRIKARKRISDLQSSPSSTQRDYALVRDYYAKLVANTKNPPEKIHAYTQFQELVHRRLSEKFKNMKFSVLIEYKRHEALAKISKSTGVTESDKMILQFIKDLNLPPPKCLEDEPIMMLVGH